MDSKPSNGAKRMTRKEFIAESDRLLAEAQVFLEDSRQISERSRQKMEKNARTLKEVEQLLSCGKN